MALFNIKHFQNTNFTIKIDSPFPWKIIGQFHFTSSLVRTSLVYIYTEQHQRFLLVDRAESLHSNEYALRKQKKPTTFRVIYYMSSFLLLMFNIIITNEMYKKC